MIENELRDTFNRHEHLAPAAGPLREAINATAVRRKRRRLITRSVTAALAVTAAMAIPAAFARDLGGKAAPIGVVASDPSTPAPALADRPLNVLLLGVDGDGADARADTVLIAHIPADRSGIFLVSLPRDGEAEVPGHGRAKLSDSFLLGGAGLTAQTLNGLTGITFDGSVTVRYSAVEAVTDELGGVRVCLDEKVTSKHTGHTFARGCHELGGAEAVDLLRQRYGLARGAYDRDRNGQRYLRALAAQAAARLDDPGEALSLLRAAGDGIALDRGGLELIGAAAQLQEVAEANVIGIAGAGSSPLRADGEERERIYPGVAKDLFAALAGDRMEEWAAENPKYLTEN